MFLFDQCNFCNDASGEINRPSHVDASCEIVETNATFVVHSCFFYKWFGGRCSLDKTREQNFQQWWGVSLWAT
jgi:hypothetical protein